MGGFWSLPWAADYWIVVIPDDFGFGWFREARTPIPLSWYTIFIHPQAEC